MAGYTEIRKPENESDFEKYCEVLFRGLLNDPGASRLGARGQRQDGVDIVGLRGRDPTRIVGIQCKLKSQGKKLTKKEVRDEVLMALAYKPALSEYFVVTTAPNDARLVQYANELMQEQKALGRDIQIYVWGWGNLSDAINRDEDAKNAFDPGYSPAVSKQNAAIEKLAEGQENLATKDQVAGIADNLSQLASQKIVLPAHFADRELTARLALALRRRGFGKADTVKELSELADLALSHEYAHSSHGVRFEILDRAARANAAPATVETADRFLIAARGLNPSGDLFLADALLKEAKGDANAALRTLRTRPNPDTRAALFNVLARTKGAEAARAWVRDENLKPSDFNPPGALNLVLHSLHAGELEAAQSVVAEVPARHFEECPALYLLRAQLTIASVLAADQKGAVFQGLPIDPSLLELGTRPGGQKAAKHARADIETLRALAAGLDLSEMGDFLTEFDLWLQLEDHGSQVSARQRIAREITDESTTLRRVRLALAYEVPFNQDALHRYLVARKELGEWNVDERFAAFLLAFHNGDRSRVTSFFEAYHEELFAQDDLAHTYLAGIEIEALARLGRFKEARQHLALHTGPHLSEEQARDLGELLSGIEGGDEAERLRQRYDDSGDLGDLRTLVGVLRAKNDFRQLATYAPILARLSPSADSFATAIKALFHEEAYAEVVALAGEFPDICAQDDEFASMHAWALFNVGRVMEARTLGRELWTRRGARHDRELAINTAVETGDWGYLQSLLATEIERIEDIEAHDSMRLARLALEVNSPYVDRFRDAALKKQPNDAQLNLSAYTLAVDRGDEYHEAEAQEWFRKAVEHSGAEGPVQSVSMKEMIDRAPSWNRNVDTIDKGLRRGEMPLFVAAKGVRRQLLDLTLGQALRNRKQADPRSRFPVLAFPGTRGPLDASGVASFALDITSIATLEYLGLLHEVLTHLQNVVIAPRTLALLFTERQFLRFHQPSQMTKARRIQDLIARGQLTVVPVTSHGDNELKNEVDDELAGLLALAKQEGGIVVRSAPVFRRGSLLEETADLSAVSDRLADTHAVLASLSSNARVEAGVETSASMYLKRVDSGWEMRPTIDANSRLYLDDLSVTYLDYVGLLEPLTKFVANVFVSNELDHQTRGLLEYAGLADELLGAIEHARITLNHAIESGRIRFSTRYMAERKGDGDDMEFSQFPTLDIAADLSGIGAVVSDDRYFNSKTNWADRGSHKIPSATTLDILVTLRNGTLTEETYWQVLHKLRAAGYCAVPLEPNELKLLLERAPISEGKLRETPELRAVRESIALPQLSGTFLATDNPWLAGIRFAVLKALRDVWLDEPDYAAAEAKGDWLFDLLPNPMEWCVEADSDTGWATCVQQVAVQAGLLMVFTSTERERSKRYFSWLDGKLMKPLRTRQPELWSATLDFVRSYMPKLIEAEDEAA